MAQMNNYFFVDTERKSKLIVPENFNSNFSLCGNCIREGFADNSYVTTSHIEELGDGFAKTHSGSVYELQKIDSDYKEFLDAVSQTIPIIEEWYLEGNLRHGYTLSGVVNGTTIVAKVISQEKNFVVLDQLGNHFVQWRDFSFEAQSKLTLFGNIADLQYSKDPEASNDFEEYCGFLCRPVLFPES